LGGSKKRTLRGADGTVTSDLKKVVLLGGGRWKEWKTIRRSGREQPLRFHPSFGKAFAHFLTGGKKSTREREAMKGKNSGETIGLLGPGRKEDCQSLVVNKDIVGRKLRKGLLSLLPCREKKSDQSTSGPGKKAH